MRPIKQQLREAVAERDAAEKKVSSLCGEIDDLTVLQDQRREQLLKATAELDEATGEVARLADRRAREVERLRVEEAGRLEAQAREEQARQEAEGDQGAIGVVGQASPEDIDGEEDGVHGSPLCPSSLRESTGRCPIAAREV